MKEKIERIKNHVNEHKVAYITGGTCLLAGVAIGVIFANKSEIKQVIDAYKIQWKSPTTNNITTVLVRRGHPGTVVLCNETGEIFASQKRAADMLGINQGNISKHLSGFIPNADGYTFTNLGEAS